MREIQKCLHLHFIFIHGLSTWSDWWLSSAISIFLVKIISFNQTWKGHSAELTHKEHFIIYEEDHSSVFDICSGSERRQPSKCVMKDPIELNYIIIIWNVASSIFFQASKSQDIWSSAALTLTILLKNLSLASPQTLLMCNTNFWEHSLRAPK